MNIYLLHPDTPFYSKGRRLDYIKTNLKVKTFMQFLFLEKECVNFNEILFTLLSTEEMKIRLLLN